jgi:hypothetical protein
MDIGGNFALVEFSEIFRLVESGKFLRRRVDNSKNLRLVDFGGFPRFQFRVKVIYYRVFLLTKRGSK